MKIHLYKEFEGELCFKSIENFYCIRRAEDTVPEIIYIRYKRHFVEGRNKIQAQYLELFTTG